MKKIFNHTKRPIPEWEDLNENKYDWDEVDLIEASEEYNEESEEEDSPYYSESVNQEDYVEENEEGYYQGEYFEEGTYEEEYYEEGTYEEGTGEEEYYEEGYYEEGTDEEEYYEEETYEGDTGEEEYYEEETYEGEEDLEAVILPMSSATEAGGARLDGRSAATARTNGRKRRRGFAGMSIMDQMVLGTGVAVLILALVTVGFFISSKIVDRQISSFVSVGNQLDGIDVIGEAGLLAVADAQLAKMAAAGLVDADQQEYQGDGYNESDYWRDVTVTMEFISIQKDLKIKFVNDNTGKLVANVPFAVQVTDPDGKSFIWSDDDMDGIIYKKDITPGSYKVAMESLTDEKYSKYTLSTLSRTVDVRKDIAYEKVNVANEIKSEDEIDASKEDTAKNDTVLESALQDTVAWVESKIIDATYIEVDPSKIPKPTSILAGSATARTSGVGGIVLTDKNETVTGGDGDVSGGDSGGSSGGDPEDTSSPSPSATPPSTVTPEPSIKLNPSTVNTVVGGIVYVHIEVENMPGVQYSLNGSASFSDEIVTATVDKDGMITITGKAAGTRQIKVMASGEDQVTKEATLNVTISPAKTITLDKSGITFVGESLVLNATVAGAVTTNFRVTSSDATVATVPASVQGTQITVSGLKIGTATITVELVESNAVTGSATCTVTVLEHPKNDKVTNLKDENNNLLYVLDNGTYRPAVYADYYVSGTKFYLQTEPKYNGWQNINGKIYYFTADGKYVTGEQVIQGAKYNFASDGTLVTGSGMLGIDVSKFNTITNWNSVKNSGVNFVIIRCGYRGSSVGGLIEDPKFKSNIQGATAVGIKVGIYFFTQALDEREAVEEASMALELVKNYKISYPIFLDVESSGGRADSLDKATRTAVCKAFCQTIQNKGYTAGIYANKSWLETKLDPSALSAYKIWLAQYRSSPTYTGRYDLWQYSSTGRINGITGDVDMDLSYLGY